MFSINPSQNSRFLIYPNQTQDYSHSKLIQYKVSPITDSKLIVPGRQELPGEQLLGSMGLPRDPEMIFIFYSMQTS